MLFISFLPKNIQNMSESSISALLSREQQLREEITKLKQEEQELKEKDDWIKQNIMALQRKRQ